ncbi:hypothetical protein L1887_12082 [Cichorium endivia]|nr:hypothetical protein L1887_12082 [Cichorium endivia]
MALLRKLLNKKPPDGLLDIFERVYVFDSCFRLETWDQEAYKAYVSNVISQFQESNPDSSVMIFNFREGDSASKIQNVLSQYYITIMDYPKHYEGCPLLSMEVIHHFLKSSESWLSLGQNNILLVHSELGGWPVLAFMLAALLLYRKHCTAESRALEMVHKQSPKSEILSMMSPLDPSGSQLRYLQYVLKRNADEQWPPADKALRLDCVITRMIPDFDGKGGCCPVFRIFGRDPLLHLEKTPKLLFSTPRRRPNVRSYNQAENELVKIDINCNIQGDIVLECINLDDDMVKETMMYRAMFNTAFIKSNTLMLNHDEIDVCWDKKEQFHKDFKAELLFSEVDAKASIAPVDLSCYEEEGLPVEAFGKVQEMFSSVDWLVPKSDDALNRLHQMALSDIVNEMLGTSFQRTKSSDLLQTLPMKGKDGTTVSHTKSKSSFAGDEKNSFAIVGPRSVSLPRQLPSSKQLEASLDGGTKAFSSLPSMPPHIILTCSHPSVTEKLETRLLEGGTSSLPPVPSSDQPPSGPPAGPPPPPPPAPPKSDGGGAPPPPPPPGGGGGPPPPPPPAAPPAPPAPKPPAPPPPKANPPPPPPPAKSGPPPPPPPANGNKGGAGPPPPPPSAKGGGVAAPSPPPPIGKSRVLSRTTAVKSQPGKKLKPLHWSKINRVGQGSLWAEAEKSGEAARAPEIDMSELETLFSASNPNSDKASKAKTKAANKPEKVSLIEHRRAYNCEIMLSKVKTPLPELMDYVLALDDSAMDVDQVDNLIKFCPTKEEMELIKIRSSVKFRRIMQTILSLGNALNQGTTRGAAVGFRLDSLLKLNETRARSTKMTLMHYLCKVLADKLPELLDFSKELGSLEPASKIQLKILAEEMQAITKGLEKVVQEKKLCKKDGHVSKRFRKSLKKFLASAEPDVKSLAALYSGVGKSVDALIIYFGEDPNRVPYESVVQTLLSFVRMFNLAHEENCKQIEAEKKAAQKAAEQEKSKAAEQERLKAAEQDRLKAEEKEKLKKHVLVAAASACVLAFFAEKNGNDLVLMKKKGFHGEFLQCKVV